jgi:hypothetical protein
VTGPENELALDAERPLDDALRLLVAPFAEVLVADDAVSCSNENSGVWTPMTTNPSSP